MADYDDMSSALPLLRSRAPSMATDAAPPERKAKGMVFLAGAIKYWWLSRCYRCSHLYDKGLWQRCPECLETEAEDMWGSDLHNSYLKYREDVRGALIDAGYLTYAPHMAFKGVWVESAQPVNDAAIAASDVMLNLSPLRIPTQGTDDELLYATRVGTPTIVAPLGTPVPLLLRQVAATIGER